MEELLEILRETGIPFAYDHFAEGEGPAPPFICYILPGSDNFAADGRVYYKINEVRIELYTDYKDIAVEQKLEAVLDRHGIFYEKTETWIESEKSSLKDVNRLLKLDPSNTELLSQKQKLLKDAISATKEKLDALKTAQEQAKQQLENGDLGQDKYDALQREIIETEQELRRLQEQAATTNAVLEKIDSVGAKMESVGDSIAGAGKKMMPLTTVIGGLGVAAVKTAADFDSSMSQVAAISGATGDDLQALRDKAREMGEKTKFSASEAADAMTYMAMAGWKSKDMISGIDGIMSLAAASGEDLATTSDIVTDALTAFGLSAKDSGVMCAVIDKKLSSEVGFKGIFKKVLIFLLVGVANILDVQVIGTGSVLRTAVIFFYISNEGVSLLENAAHLGLPIPQKVKTVLEQLHERSESEEK